MYNLMSCSFRGASTLDVACRGVAQPGRAPGSGPGGRRFKSSLPDQYLQQLAILASCWGTQRGTHSLLTVSGWSGLVTAFSAFSAFSVATDTASTARVTASTRSSHQLLP